MDGCVLTRQRATARSAKDRVEQASVAGGGQQRTDYSETYVSLMHAAARRS